MGMVEPDGAHGIDHDLRQSGGELLGEPVERDLGTEGRYPIARSMGRQ
jgi:hypothetical protein